MAEDDSGSDKTEDPSDRKLSKAREEGNIAQTPEVKILASMVIALIIVGLMGPGLLADFKVILRPFLEHTSAIGLEPSSLQNLMIELALKVALIMMFPLAIVWVVGVAFQMIMARGFLWVPKKINPDLKKLSPLKGLKRIFSANQLMELVKALAKIGVVGSIIIWVIFNNLDKMSELPFVSFPAILDFIHAEVYTLIFITMMLMIVLTALDFAWQRWRFIEQMKMTKQEVKDEHKQSEGDPQVKARLRSIRMNKARRRMMAAVPTADVIVVNPTHYAVALKYDENTQQAPILVAKGLDLIAKRIRDLAKENDIPIVENPPLARALYASVELDQEIPPDHYKAVAEVIGYVMRLKGKVAK